MSWFRILPTILTCAVVLPETSRADEGVSAIGSPASTAALRRHRRGPRWSWAVVYLHSSADAAADQAFPRGGRGLISLRVSGRGDIVAFGPTYTLNAPVLGGQLSLSLLATPGSSEASADVTLTGQGGQLIATRFVSVVNLVTRWTPVGPSDPRYEWVTLAAASRAQMNQLVPRSAIHASPRYP
jgi:hypothetical protein